MTTIWHVVQVWVSKPNILQFFEKFQIEKISLVIHSQKENTNIVIFVELFLHIEWIRDITLSVFRLSLNNCLKPFLKQNTNALFARK